MKRFAMFCLMTVLCVQTSAGGGDKPAEDPAATKLLREARAARADWPDFPGFSADVTVNNGGKISKGKVEVSATGKVKLELADKDEAGWVRREIASLVSHRLPSESSKPTPCAFVGKDAEHPSGRAIRVLADEMHSGYRVRDRQILEVNRQMGDIRFTITVLENVVTKEKKFLPTAYVVNTWDLKSKELKSGRSYHHRWKRMGSLDLPEAVTIVTGTPGRLEVQEITFSNLKLRESGAR